MTDDQKKSEPREWTIDQGLFFYDRPGGIPGNYPQLFAKGPFLDNEPITAKSVKVIERSAYDRLKAERDQWKEMAERLVLAVRLEKGPFPSKFTNDILDEFERMKSKL